MKRAPFVVSTFVFTAFLLGTIFLIGGTATAYPTQGRPCTDCHSYNGLPVVDPNVIVSATFVTSNNGWCDYDVAVSHTYDDMEGFAVFDGAANIKNGNLSPAGTKARVSLGPGKTYTIRGVSNSLLHPRGGSNLVQVTPDCISSCIDVDGDGYSGVGGGACGQWDCNDNDPNINPGVAEIKHDGIDQDCNGYDLTIDILKATYSKKRVLTVEATSAYGAYANLFLVNYGSSMMWDPASSKWTISISSSGNPGTVAVSGPEGQQTSTVTRIK